MKVAADIPPLEATYEDDPRVTKDAATEDYSLHVVPGTWRSSRGSLSMAWFAMYSSMFWMVLAGGMSLAVGTVNTLIGIGLAIIYYSLVNWTVTGQAIKTGQTVALFSRSIFGYVGAALATAIFAASALYYAVFEGSVIAVASHEYFGGLSLNLWYLVVILVSVPLVFGGIQVWLDKFNGVLLPFYVLGIIVAIIWAIAEFGYSGAWFSSKPESMAGIVGPGWLFAFNAYMGVSLLIMFTWDLSRFGRKEDRKFLGTVTFGPVFYILTLLVNGMIGIFLINTIPTVGMLSEISIVLALVSLMGFAGIVLIWVSQLRINTVNFYLSSSNMQSFFARVAKLHLPRTVWVVVVGVCAYSMMLADVFSFLFEAIRYQGIAIVAWVGIALTHVVSSKVKALTPEPEFRPGRVPLFNPGGLVAWFGAAGLGIVLIETGGPWTATWSAPLTFAVSSGLYALSLLVAKRRWYVMDRPHDPRDEVDDPWAARIACSHCEKAYLAVEMDRDPGNGHKPICAACASESPTFYHQAHEESKAGARLLTEPEPDAAVT